MVPRIWVLSDLHLEDINEDVSAKFNNESYDMLVAAGDIWRGNILGGLKFLREIAPAKPIIMVLGNHEYWNGEVEEQISLARMAATQNGITLLEREEAMVAGIRFVGATLWSSHDIGGAHADDTALTGEQIEIDHGSGSHLITIRDARALHLKARRQLETMIKRPDAERPLIVVTHHAPHPLCVPDDTVGDRASLASDLSQLTDIGYASLWIHGHVHSSIDITRPNGTRILCNPGGYKFSNRTFDASCVVNI
ncbi:MAG: hypothetical protein B7Y12_04520 [Rhizobiales bacterium 24-66-13]|nr:MAG: hypothetical protein B7Y61_03130 [Rhizobiales bacterium 35-66-30]OYZ82180.1 MAG: hypothetical protein B7Y12_04520 [Rhizobiales bacterium 24-66-13]OZB11166.1 MAG: hypothetical protein B7X67_04920 [Rhizobiales bacterium 39-66-18]